MSFRSQMRYMNPYDIHKAIINEYVLKKPGDTKLLNKRDSSTDKTVYDVLKQNHKFIWDEKTTSDSWEQQFAKKYYDKLFKEYCIGDLSRYKENKIALRWRIESEVVIGKGQFICGNKKCLNKEELRSWEVNFSYSEAGEKKNALVKIRLCPECSIKLNHFSKKREIKRIKSKRKSSVVKKRLDSTNSKNSDSDAEVELAGPSQSADVSNSSNDGTSPWDNIKPVEIKSREDEMEEYLQDLLL